MQPTMLPKLTDTTQTITFTDSEDGQPMMGEVYATDVLVNTNAGAHSHGSSKVKLKSLVDYNWEPKLYSGQLLAMHISGKYLAYCVKAPNPGNPGTWCGMVRVVYNPQPDRRVLIKGMKGEVQDLAFAHIQNQVVLACIDEHGNFFVHEIEVTDTGLRCTLVAEVREDSVVAASGSTLHRVVWCPYIPDDDDAPDDDVARLLLTTHCNVARMWNIGSIRKCVEATDSRGDASALLTHAGALAAADHSAPIVDAAFSPDGTALATASHDGYVMFFQRSFGSFQNLPVPQTMALILTVKFVVPFVSMSNERDKQVYMLNEGSPRCLHKWQPHGGKPLSCLFFLDNHKNYNTDVQFWKFAVTGADQNTQIKIWSCKSWNCLQTITFTPALGNLPPADPPLGLKAMLDTSASYLLLSDFRARSLYVLNMARDKDDSMAYCKSVSEYLLPYPVLSFCIIDAEEDTAPESVCESPFRRNGSSASVEPLEEARGVRLRLYIVQPKGLQEGELLFVSPHSDMLTDGNGQQTISFPDLSELALEDKSESVSGAMASSILQQQSQQLKNLLMRAQSQPGSLVQRDEPPHALNLMTPDAFSSPGKREEDDPPLAATPEVGPRAPLEDPKLTSGGSSPSREVQQIMAHNPALYKDDLPNDDEDEEETTQTPVVEEDGDTSVVVQNGTETIFPSNDIFVSPEKPPKLTHSSSDTSWPQISLAQITEANQRKASSDKSSCQSLNNSLNISAVERAGSDEPRVVSGLSAADKNRLELLEHKLDKLCDLVMQQSRELRGLRAEVASPRDMIDSALAAHAQRTSAAIESALQDGWERIARVGETASSRAAQAAGVGAARALEPLAAALQHELASKLTATDHLLRDNIEKLANSKTVMEHLSSSIASSLSDMVRESFRGALLSSVVPVMEKAHKQMFAQVTHAFQTGTKEFAANTEAAARAAAERGGATATAALRQALERHTAALSSAAPPSALIAATLRDVAHGVLEKELSWWRSEARAAALQMSRAHSPATPASHVSAVDRQMQVAQIQSLMSGGDVNGAFQLALSASDLALVVAACRAVDPAAVFGPPCKLKQNVLLSLVQQLAADMSKDTTLKHRYLEEAIMNLDTSNPVTREHIPIVVRELQKQIVSFIASSPAHSLQRQFKMLLMATDSLVKSAV